MIALRALGRLALLLGLTLYCVIRHLLVRHRGHSPWPRTFLGRAARLAGFDIRIEGAPLAQDVFFVANHLSWIDILAMGGATGCAFISKDDVQTAPIVGWLAAQNNTIFIAREKRGTVSSQIDSVRMAMAAHQPITLFPEGVTGDGIAILPFKPALFSVLLPPPRAIRVQPVLIDYGAATSLVAWADNETGIANARRILGAPGRRTIILRFLAPFDPDDHIDRKTLAMQTRQQIAQAWAAR
jgi:1-acyl-sn-glycerol-3-phosphate acyltransferase